VLRAPEAFYALPELKGTIIGGWRASASIKIQPSMKITLKSKVTLWVEAPFRGGERFCLTSLCL
jgi:hypothetical protein